MVLTRDKNFYKALLSLAVPIVLQNFITYSVGLADNLMIGSLGDSAVSGVYMGTQVQTVLQVVSAGVEGGILILAGQYWGKKDLPSIRRIVSIGMRITFIAGFLLTLICALFPNGVMSVFTNEQSVIEKGAEYLGVVCWSYVFFCITQSLIAAMRSVESARIGLVVSLSSLVIDVILNYILIFGKFGFPELGVRGAAIATLIARICETAITVVYTFFMDRKLNIKVPDFLKIDRTLLKDFIRYGTPLILGQLVWGSNLIANSIILGHFSESVITATSLANNMSNLMYVSMNGMAAAVGIIISKTVGSGDVSRIREYSRTTQVLFLCLGILTSGVIFAIRMPFISLYSITPESAICAKQFIGVLCVTSIGTCYQCGCLMGLVKSGGDVGFVFKNDTIFVFCVVIPSAIITQMLGCPAWVVYFCLKCDQLLKCIVAFFKIRSYNWMKNLTRNN